MITNGLSVRARLRIVTLIVSLFICGLGVAMPTNAQALVGCYWWNDTSTSPCATQGTLYTGQASGWRSARIQHARKVSVFTPGTWYMGLWRYNSSAGTIQEWYSVAGGNSYTAVGGGTVYQNLLYNHQLNNASGNFTSSTIW